MISPENSNLNKINLKISLINVHYILFYSLLIIFFHLYKKLRGVKHKFNKVNVWNYDSSDLSHPASLGYNKVTLSSCEVTGI